MKKVVVLFGIFFSVAFCSCEKEYRCICTDITTNETYNGDVVKTTKLGKKGFEQTCKSHNGENNLDNCHIE